MFSSGKCETRQNEIYKLNFTLKVTVNPQHPTPTHPPKSKDINQGILHLWAEFGDPSLNGNCVSPGGRPIWHWSLHRSEPQISLPSGDSQFSTFCGNSEWKLFKSPKRRFDQYPGSINHFTSCWIVWEKSIEFIPLIIHTISLTLFCLYRQFMVINQNICRHVSWFVNGTWETVYLCLCQWRTMTWRKNMGKIASHFFIMKPNEVQTGYNMYVIYCGVWMFCNKIKISTIFNIYSYGTIRDN